MTNRVKSFFSLVAGEFKYKKVLLNVTYVLGKVGITISPYYFYLEEADNRINIKLSPALDSTVSGFLSPADLEKVYHHPETQGYAALEKVFKDDKHFCFALKQGDEVMSFTWCDMDKIRWVKSIDLKPDEAYMFNAYTYKKYRGMNIAPYLRFYLYKYLKELGRTKIYSYTEYFNTPAVNYKKKLKAKPLKLGLYIRLFSKIKWDLTLKKYKYK